MRNGRGGETTLLTVANAPKRRFEIFLIETDLPSEYCILFRKRPEEDLSRQIQSLRPHSFDTGNCKALDWLKRTFFTGGTDKKGRFYFANERNKPLMSVLSSVSFSIFMRMR